ncbi:MAG: glycosyltransferase family 39 protein [Deltaproteobacteria bacterium]|nr:glycosyltransferase family 39 protein [Deltaproteobacteria bacterium]
MRRESATSPSRETSRRATVGVFALALALRLAVVAWAASRIPPTADGTFYQTVAERIARGLGYTWLWPDGAVTYAAHYPVGYPALLGAAYAVFGASAAVAMSLQALLGALAAAAVHRLLARHGRAALIGGLLVAVHPGLVAYTPAMMTEGVAASLVLCATFAASRARHYAGTRSRDRIAALLATGVLAGLAVLVRPQLLVLAPVLGLVAAAPRRRPRAATAALITGLALVTCAPWTLRNCARMNRCALVSVNGGWNLLLGTNPEARGGWAPLEVPAECRTVFDEAGKDTCFGEAARVAIAGDPVAWLRLMPGKWRATFDYCGAAGWYLHQANPLAFDHRDKLALGITETAFERVMLVMAMLGTAGAHRPRGRLRARLDAASLFGGLGLALSPWGHLAHLVLTLRLAAVASTYRFDPLRTMSAALLASTFVIHGVFFGGGRYQLPLLPFVAAVGALARLPWVFRFRRHAATA